MSESWEIFSRYVNPTVIVSIMVVGLAWNFVLLFIFIRHKEVRTPANTMILNLVVSDILNLGIGAPHHLIFHYPQTDPDHIPACRVHTTVRVGLYWLSAISVLVLNMQRYYVSSSNMKCSTYCPLLYVLVVWLLSFILVLPTFLWDGVYKYMCTAQTDKFPIKVVIGFYVFLFCLLFPTLMVIFNFMTARKIKRSTSSVSLGRLSGRSRLRSARVVTLLAIVFVITYEPKWVWNLFTYCLDFDRNSTALLVFEYVSNWLLFTNSCFNPMALYIASGKFRQLYRKYLLFSTCAGRKNEPVDCLE